MTEIAISGGPLVEGQGKEFLFTGVKGMVGILQYRLSALRTALGRTEGDRG